MIHPLSYSIPDEYIVSDVPEKKHVWAEIVPGFLETYRFGPGEEEDYLQMYRESRFAFTMKKGGWDALRHYEIIASGCIPVFCDLDQCPTQTMSTYPKSLIKQACNELLPWKQTPEYVEKYNVYVRQLLQHTRDHLSCSAVAKQFLQVLNAPPNSKILFIRCNEGENYLRELTYIGLNRYLNQHNGATVCWPKIRYLYDDYPASELKNRYGFGYVYTRRLITNQQDIDQSELERTIRACEWDYIVYSKMGVWDGPEGTIYNAPFWESVRSSYSKNNIIFLYGGDALTNTQDFNSPFTRHLIMHSMYGHCFVRELMQ